MMKKPKYLNCILLILAALVVILNVAGNGSAQDEGLKRPIPEGVYIKLTKDFYEALKNTGTEGIKTYSNNPSSEYLKEIAVSARFLVETNLQLLKQQEEMIQLMRSFMQTKRASGQ